MGYQKENMSAHKGITHISFIILSCSILACGLVGCDKTARVETTTTTTSVTPPPQTSTTTDQKTVTTTVDPKVLEPSEKTKENLNAAAANINDKADKAAKRLGEKAEEAGQYLGDAALTASVKGKIINDQASRINVQTENGVVTITGTVDSQEASDRAVELARGLKGVKSVVNKLVVKRTT